MQEDLISVIVPIYNIEEYLENCIRSIQQQTYHKIEIILVDDGSTDRCPEICDEFSKEDNRILVIHKENGGLSDARNVGLEKARGQYFMLIDGDDFIHKNTIEILHTALVKENAQIAVTAFQRISEEQISDYFKIASTNPTSEAFVLLTTNEDKKAFFLETHYDEFTVAWNKLYHKELFQDIKYPKGKIHEDEFTTYRLLDKASRIVFIENSLYYYVQRNQSIMAEPFSEKRFHRLEAYAQRMDYYWEGQRYDWYERILFLYRIFLFRYWKEVAGKDDIIIQKWKKFQRQYRKYVLKSIRVLPIGFMRKCSYFVSAMMPRFYCSQ